MPAEALRDDMRAYLPELLPRFTTLVAEAERSSNYSCVRPALRALEALGPALEEHLQLTLPLLVRLVSHGLRPVLLCFTVHSICICTISGIDTLQLVQVRSYWKSVQTLLFIPDACSICLNGLLLCTAVSFMASPDWLS